MMKASLIPLLIISSILLTSCQTMHTDPEVTSKRAKFHYQIGMDSLQRGQLPKAFDELMQANKALPGQSATLSALAYAWRLQGDMEKSEDFYKQSIAAGPASEVYTNYGSLLVSLKRFREAETILHKALEDPRYRKQYIALLLLGDALLGQNHADDAIQSYHRAVMMNPSSKSISQIKEAQAYIQTGRLHYAQGLYETMLRQDPTLRPALQGLLKLLVQQDDILAARKHLANYIEKEKAPLNRAWASDELTRLGRL
ncbi:MAG: tetratricopeptide repeat protein [Mariprofundaceae bacterium]|nr:tetratricopeptide repeat protein [Mariprofundaceae bacterium]